MHFPTDLWLLWDSLRKSLDTIVLLRKEMDLKCWREVGSWKRKVKTQYRHVSNIHRKKGKDYQLRLKTACGGYLKMSGKISSKLSKTIEELDGCMYNLKVEVLKTALKKYYDYVLKLSDQVGRRLLKGEKIPHEEKIFSIFEEHTEWISKGKIGRSAELGHRVLITTDQYNFIVDHQVMEKKTDKEMPIELGKRLSSVFGEGYHLSSISFDRGFYSGPAKEELSKIFDLVVMPKPGKQSKEAVAEQSGVEYQHQKRRHSTVEANINELEYCGADKVPDKGIVGYKKYVALSVLTYNIKRLGKVVKAEGLLSTIRDLDGKKVA